MTEEQKERGLEETEFLQESSQAVEPFILNQFEDDDVPADVWVKLAGEKAYFTPMNERSRQWLGEYGGEDWISTTSLAVSREDAEAIAANLVSSGFTVKVVSISVSG